MGSSLVSELRSGKLSGAVQNKKGIAPKLSELGREWEDREREHPDWRGKGATRGPG